LSKFLNLTCKKRKEKGCFGFKTYPHTFGFTFKTGKGFCLHAANAAFSYFLPKKLVGEKQFPHTLQSGKCPLFYIAVFYAPV